MIKKLIIITGGNLDVDFTCDFINKYANSYIIAVDKGLEYLNNIGVIPDVILGDFDSLNPNILKKYENKSDTLIKRFPCEKDDTDTQLAIKWATDICISNNTEFDEIFILGATGTRIDHLLGNIHGLTYAYDKGISCCIIDTNNKIFLVPEEYRIVRDNQFGRYISFFAIDGDIELSLIGFKYPLKDYSLSVKQSLAVSNEIVDDEAVIIHRKGYLLGIESRD